MMADTTDTTGVGENRAAAVDSVLVGAEGQVRARGRADLGETLEASGETERPKMQRHGVFRLRSVPCSPSLRMEWSPSSRTSPTF